LAERFVDLPIQFVNYPSLIMRPVSPAQQFKIQGRVPEGTKPHPGLRFGHDERVIASHGEKNLLHLIHIGPIGNPYFDSHPKSRLGGAFVYDFGTGDNRIGDGNLDIISGNNPGTA
jgi:hypothetical protein